MASKDSLEAITDPMVLRPDFYELFPVYSPQELLNRLEIMSFHQATLLGLKNITSVLLTAKGRAASKVFFMQDLENQRNMLVEIMLLAGISPRSAQAIGKIKREMFAPPKYLSYCYINHSLYFDSLSCLSTPGLVGLMIDWLTPEPGQTILEVGIGSGYHAACVSESVNNCCSIYGLEMSKKYAAFGQAALAHAGYQNIYVQWGDGNHGWPTNKQFDRVYITASFFDTPPASLVAQLREGGILQGIRAITQDEFESEHVTTWLRKTFPSYEHYRKNNWRSYSCLFTAKKEGEHLVELSRLYDVTFTPLHQQPDAYSNQYVDPFFELTQGLKGLS